MSILEYKGHRSGGGGQGKQNPANKGDSRGVRTVGTMFYIATFVCTVVVMATPPLS